MVERETADEIEAAAAEWLWRLDRHGPSDALKADLELWLAADPRRRGAYLKAEAVWATVGGEADLLIRSTPRPFTRRTAVLAGGAALAAGIGALMVALPGEHYGTNIGEIRRVPLKDGSTAAINTQTRIDVAWSPERRVVKLHQGEVWFQVAKNPARPFIVEAGNVRVEAVGTAFSVRRREHGAEVIVTEGVVEAWSEGAEGHRVRLSAGALAYVADNSEIIQSAAAASDTDRKLAWRDGKIDLAGETLEEAVADINRYNQRKIIVSDPGLAKQRFYGVFRTDDPMGFAMAVHRSLGAGIESEGEADIRIIGPGG